jgi:hypothetical protein
MSINSYNVSKDILDKMHKAFSLKSTFPKLFHKVVLNISPPDGGVQFY